MKLYAPVSESMNGRKVRKMVTTLNIKGMSCKHCVMAVTKVLGQIKGISNVHVDLERGQASFEHGDALEMKTLKEGIEKAGYQVD